jgi:hypothetical protein
MIHHYGLRLMMMEIDPLSKFWRGIQTNFCASIALVHQAWGVSRVLMLVSHVMDHFPIWLLVRNLLGRPIHELFGVELTTVLDFEAL